MIDWLIAFQKWLYSGMSEGMKSTVDLSGLLGLTGAAFLFGVVHALMPGHGKSVLVSYHLGRPSKLL
jgi:nickel/cobalt exporter